MEHIPHWATTLKYGDKCYCTIRHMDDGTKNRHNVEITIIDVKEGGAYVVGRIDQMYTVEVPFNELYEEPRKEKVYHQTGVAEPLKGSTEEPLTDNEEELEIARLCSAFFGTLAQAQKPLDPRIAKVIKEHFWEYCGSASPLEPLHETTDAEFKRELENQLNDYALDTDYSKGLYTGFEHGANWAEEFLCSRLLPSNPESPSNEWSKADIKAALNASVSAIYFSDSSDYLTYHYSVIRSLTGLDEVTDEKINALFKELNPE